MADDVLKPTQLHDLDRRHVIQLAAGATHSCALTEDGAVVVFGTGALGQLGRDSGGIRQWEPLQLQLPNRSGARLVAAGPYQTLVVMRDGSAYIMGRSLFDTRKLPTDAKALARYRSSGPCPPLLTPTAVPLTMSGNNIAQVVVGLNHALFLMEDGSVSSYGVGQHGVLGHGDPKDRAQPAKVAALGDRKMEFVAVGEHSSAALDVQGHVWVWGCDLTSELNAQGLLAERALPVHLKSVPAVRTGRRGSLGSSELIRGEREGMDKLELNLNASSQQASRARGPVFR